jgi:hypothetical protein
MHRTLPGCYGCEVESNHYLLHEEQQLVTGIDRPRDCFRPKWSGAAGFHHSLQQQASLIESLLCPAYLHSSAVSTQYGRTAFIAAPCATECCDTMVCWRFMLWRGHLFSTVQQLRQVQKQVSCHHM